MRSRARTRRRCSARRRTCRRRCTSRPAHSRRARSDRRRTWRRTCTACRSAPWARRPASPEGAVPRRRPRWRCRRRASPARRIRGRGRGSREVGRSWPSWGVSARAARWPCRRKGANEDQPNGAQNLSNELLKHTSPHIRSVPRHPRETRRFCGALRASPNGDGFSSTQVSACIRAWAGRLTSADCTQAWMRVWCM